MKLEVVAMLRNKSIILHPGMDFTLLDSVKMDECEKNTPVIVWNHRWEHDKNPSIFFQALFDLDKEGVPFKLIILCQSFTWQPTVFEAARRKLAHRIIYFGYAEDKRKYYELLGQGTMVISTSIHEFYGMSVIEAVRGGCRPLLPRRLSYPELFPDKYLYDDEEFAQRVKKDLELGGLKEDASRKLTQKYSWETLSFFYKDWLSTHS